MVTLWYNILLSDVTTSTSDISRVNNKPDYVTSCWIAHLIGVFDLGDLPDRKCEGKVHLLFPRGLVCNIIYSKSPEPNNMMMERLTHRGKGVLWPRSPWECTTEQSRDQGSSARAASGDKITANNSASILHICSVYKVPNILVKVVDTISKELVQTSRNPIWVYWILSLCRKFEFVGRVCEKQMASLKYGMRHFSWQRSGRFGQMRSGRKI